MKKILFKEIQASTDFDKVNDDPLIVAIKEYFNKKENVELVELETQGDQVTLSIRAELSSKEEQNQYKREEGKQLSYDIKYKLEQELQNKFSYTPLSIRGVNVVNKNDEDYVEFEINFIYRNTGNKKLVTEKVSTKETFLEFAKRRLQEKMVLAEGYSIIQKKATEKLFKDPDVEYIITLINKLFLKKGAKIEDFAKFEKLHKTTLSKLIFVRNQVTAGEPLTYPLGDPAAYQTLITDLKSIVDDSEPVLPPNPEGEQIVPETQPIQEMRRNTLYEEVIKEILDAEVGSNVFTKDQFKLEDWEELLGCAEQTGDEMFETGSVENGFEILGNQIAATGNWLSVVKTMADNNLQEVDEHDIIDPEFMDKYEDYEELRKQHDSGDLDEDLDLKQRLDKMQVFSLSNLEDLYYENPNKIKDNMDQYGFTIEDLENLSYYDLAHVLGVDTRLLKDIDAAEYGSYLAGLLNSPEGELDEAKKKGVNEKISLNDFPGLPEEAKAFNPFEVLAFITDPGYGYSDVKLLLLKFSDGEYGLCIYDTGKKRFIEEPSDLEDYNQTIESISEEYPNFGRAIEGDQTPGQLQEGGYKPSTESVVIDDMGITYEEDGVEVYDELYGVEVTIEYEVENASFSHEFGTERFPDHLEVVGWEYDKEKYSEAQQQGIDKWLEKHARRELEQKFASYKD